MITTSTAATRCTSYRFASGKRSLAALKRGLHNLGVIGSDRVADGTPALDAEQAHEFDTEFARLRERVGARLPDYWVSRAEESEA